jgi:sialic acid synthase SpsE
MENFNYRLANEVTDKELFGDMESGKRTRPSQPLNEFEINEAVDFLQSHDCVAIKTASGSIMTNDPEFMQSTIKHYALRKLGILVANGENPRNEIAKAMAFKASLNKK